MGFLSRLFSGGATTRATGASLALSEIDPGALDVLIVQSEVEEGVVRSTLEKLLGHARFSASAHAAARTGAGLVAKRVSLPDMGDRELRESLEWEAEQWIPFDVDDAAIDHAVLSRTGGQMDILLVAARTR